MDILATLKEFVWGVLKRAYWFIPALLSRPLDVFGIVSGTKLSSHLSSRVLPFIQMTHQHQLIHGWSLRPRQVL